MQGVRRVPYGCQRLLEAIGKHQIVYICEGEKDCNNLHGLTATTNPGGANKWQDELTSHFASADVVIIADNDERERSTRLTLRRS
jgi:DNA primase